MACFTAPVQHQEMVGRLFCLFLEGTNHAASGKHARVLEQLLDNVFLWAARGCTTGNGSSMGDRRPLRSRWAGLVSRRCFQWDHQGHMQEHSAPFSGTRHEHMPSARTEELRRVFPAGQVSSLVDGQSPSAASPVPLPCNHGDRGCYLASTNVYPVSRCKLAFPAPVQRFDICLTAAQLLHLGLTVAAEQGSFYCSAPIKSSFSFRFLLLPASPARLLEIFFMKMYMTYWKYTNMKNKNKEKKNPVSDGVWLIKQLMNTLCLQLSQTSRSFLPIWPWCVHTRACSWCCVQVWRRQLFVTNDKRVCSLCSCKLHAWPLMNLNKHLYSLPCTVSRSGIWFINKQHDEQQTDKCTRPSVHHDKLSCSISYSEST